MSGMDVKHLECLVTQSHDEIATAGSTYLAPLFTWLNPFQDLWDSSPCIESVQYHPSTEISDILQLNTYTFSRIHWIRIYLYIYIY